MKTSLLLYLFAFTSFVFPLEALCQTQEKDFDSLIAAQFPTDGPGGVVLVAKQGDVIYKKSFGKANLELDVPMTENHVFRLGSNSKQFTAVAILKLAEEGKLSLTDDIKKFIPDYPTHDKKITIEHLLTHTSGIKNYTGISKWTTDVKRKDLKPKELVDFFKDEPMDFEPGTSYRYSNSGYVFLGYIIELVTGKTYDKYLNEALFQPLDMKNSFYDHTTKVIANRASGYRKVNGTYENSDFMSMTLPYAAGSLLSTADDMLLWYEALMHKKVLSDSMLGKAHRSYKLNNGNLTGYGYGWAIGNVQGSRTIKHTGVVNGFVTYTSYLPHEKIFIAIFSNFEGAGDLNIPASKIGAMLLNKPYKYSKIELEAKQLESYQAEYDNKSEGKKIIAYQDGQLLYYSKGGAKSVLIPYKKDKFFIENSLNSIDFKRNAKGKIASFDLNSTDLPLTWVRTESVVKTVKTIIVAQESLRKYEGKYKFSNSMIFEVVIEGSKLYGKVGQDKKELIPFFKNQFLAKGIDATIIFHPEENGTVSGLTKIQNSEMEAKRID